MLSGQPSQTIPLYNYVQVSKMEIPDNKGGDWKNNDNEWTNEDWANTDSDWACDCEGPPPPTFYLPPPPMPPGLNMIPSSSQGCSAPWSCSDMGASTPEDLLTPAPRAQLAVVLVSAVTFVGLVVVAAVIVYRLRVSRGHGPKGCTELNGAIIYDDLPVASTLLQGRTTTRYKPAPTGDEDDQLGVGLHLYSPEPRHLQDHLYHTISSGSETCSYSTSEAMPTDGKALLPNATPSIHRPRHITTTGTPLRHPIPSAPPVDTDSDEDTTQPMLRHLSDDDSSSTPSHARYYYVSGAPNSIRTSSTSDEYENVYYVGGHPGRPATPQERGLPPLPSRSDRFRIYFSNDRTAQGHHKLKPLKRGAREEMYIPYSPQRRVLDSEDPLYENLP